MGSPVWLQDLKWEDVKGIVTSGSDTVIIPIGSVEQHGRHLPLGTDTYVAITLAEEASESTGTPISPPLWFGWSPHHLALPGSISIRAEVLIEVLFDMMKSLSLHGFRKFVLINGHRIVNIPWMQIAAERAQRELGIRAVIFDPSFMSRDIVRELDFGDLGHSDDIETSHMLFRYPQLADMSRAVDYEPGKRVLYSVDPSYKEDTLCYVPGLAVDLAKAAPASGGTTGTPTRAAAQKGEKYHKHLVSRLVEVIKSMQK